ncbi:MAG TPA: c-type cytochrome [Candidatus Kapabacteria bacterium]|nr:c-type cytochrome [Candidatus Kapabacteria bacterium]
MSMTNPAPKKAPWWNPAKWFAVRREIPVEQRSYTKIYGILSMMLFAFTVWAVLNEAMTRRPWKDIQADFKDFKKTRLEIERKKEVTKIPVDVRKSVRKELADSKKAMESDKYLTIASKLDDMDKEIAQAQRDYTFTKSRADEAYYNLDEDRIQHKDTAGAGKSLRALEAQMAKEGAVVTADTAKRGNYFRTQALPYQAREKKAQGVYDSVFAGVIAIDRKIESVDDMPIAIRQTLLFNYEQTNFGNLKMRVDRCETCHLSYADPLFRNDTLVSTDATEIKNWLKANKYNDKDHYKIEKLGVNKDTTVAVVSALFRIHPKVDLYIKTHKLGEPTAPGVLGCTSCHGGQGPSIVSTDFAHGFEHHWEQPLLTGHYIESSCQNCHSGKYDFEGANYISQGKKLFVGFGCYGCHTMPGFETTPGQAPSLLSITKKVTPDWIYQWIKNPRGWSHNTRMPNFMLSDPEATAITAFIVDQAKGSNYSPLAHYSGGGDIARGKQTFFDAGCIACHAIDEYKSNDRLRLKEGDSFGPDLNKEGSKVTAEWVFDWIKNPKNYLAHSRMPSLRLTDEEASDLTAFVMSHTGANDSAKNSFSADITDHALVAKGEKLIRGYGCFGCHEIKGMEHEAKVSVPLSTFGKKTPGELFYGDLDGKTLGGWRTMFKKAGLELGNVEGENIHEDQDWYTWTVGKMMNSRVYKTERIDQKMPNFQMSVDEAYALSVFLRSQTGAYIAPGYADSKDDPTQVALDKGRFFVEWNNCVGCHKIEAGGGYVAKFINDKFAGDQNLAYFAPPYLGPEGSRVQENWLHQFLQGPFKIRPLVKLRMPSFGFSDGDISTATNYFLGMHDRQFVLTSYDYPVNQTLVPHGKELFDKLKCLSCHYVNASEESKAKSPNLTNVKKRIRPEWLDVWLARPDSIMPGTPMTSFWISGGKQAAADPVILGGNAKMQIQAVKEYLHSIGTDVVPSPSPYATIGGSPKYVLPNGDYEAAMARMEMPTAESFMAKPLAPNKGTAGLISRVRGRKLAAR